LSGAGEAAIAIIDVFGPDARAVVERLTGRPLTDRPAVCKIGDEVVVRWVPSGFTRETTVAITCHGGAAAWQSVMRRLVEQGVTAVEPRVMIRRAWERGAVDRAQAEAYWHLPSARTHRAARMLNDQWAGALSCELRAGKIEELLERAALGIALVTPPRVALVGPPNAGKSTLFNALLQRERALVSPVAGTTRDPVRDLVAIEGIPIELIDTAGIEEARDELEAQAIERTRRQAREAQLVLAVAEAGTEDSTEGLRVWTKCDVRAPSVPGIPVSAVQGTGLDELRRAILRELKLDVRDLPGQGMIFTARQRDAIRRDPHAYLSGPPDLEVIA
jgi:tRNA modification GTPase